MDEYRDAVTMVCHHAGYGTDWLTIPADNTYLWLFGTEPVFAPALSIDRSSSSATSNQRAGVPIMLPYGLDDITAALTARLSQPAYVSLDIAVTLTDNTAHVTVSGERAFAPFTVNPPRIVVGITEDNIAPRRQAGVAEGDTFIHNHVNRVYNATWGKELHFDGDTYLYECTFTLDPAWQRSNLNVVAYVWDYSPDDLANSVVCNFATLPYALFEDNGASIDALADDSHATPTAYYTLSGVRVPRPATGTYIVVYTDGTARKEHRM